MRNFHRVNASFSGSRSRQTVGKIGPFGISSRYGERVYKTH